MLQKPPLSSGGIVTKRQRAPVGGALAPCCLPGFAHGCLAASNGAGLRRFGDERLDALVWNTGVIGTWVVNPKRLAASAPWTCTVSPLSQAIACTTSETAGTTLPTNRTVSAPALTQFPEFGLQRLPRRLFFPQTVLRLPQPTFGLLQELFSLP